MRIADNVVLALPTFAPLASYIPEGESPHALEGRVFWVYNHGHNDPHLFAQTDSGVFRLISLNTGNRKNERPLETKVLPADNIYLARD